MQFLSSASHLNLIILKQKVNHNPEFERKNSDLNSEINPREKSRSADV